MATIIFLILFGIPAAGLWIGLYAWLKQHKKKTALQRIEVTAYVVHYAAWQRPQKITFDYPLPNGQYQRVSRSVLYSPAQLTGGNVVPGTPFTVYVHPDNPMDVSLGGSNASNGVPILLGLAAAMFTIFALAATAMTLAY